MNSRIVVGPESTSQYMLSFKGILRVKTTVMYFSFDSDLDSDVEINTTIAQLGHCATTFLAPDKKLESEPRGLIVK